MIASDTAALNPRVFGQRRPLPNGFFPTIALLAVAFGAAAVSLKSALVALGILFAVALIVYILVRPIAGFHFALWFFPVYTLLRALREAYAIPLAASGLRLWTDGLLALIFAGLTIGLIRQRRRVHVTYDDLPILILLIGGVYGTAVALLDRITPAAPFFGWHLTLNATLFYFLIRWLRPTRAQQSGLIATLILSFLLLAAASFFDYLHRTTFGMNLAHGMRPYFVPEGWDRYTYWRVYPRMQSFLYDENVWGTLCSLLSLLGIAALSERRPRPHFFVIALIGMAGILCSMSRGALIGWAVGVVVLACARGWHQGRIAALVAIILALGAGVILRYGDDPRIGFALRRADTISTKTVQNEGVASDRTFQWKLGWQIFLDLPSGKGLGTVGNAAFLSKYGMPVVADGIYVRVLAEQGVVGALSLLLFMLGILWNLLRHATATTGYTRILNLWLLAFFCGFATQGIGANTWDYYYIPPVFFMFYGIFLYRRNEEIIDAARAVVIRELGSIPVESAVPTRAIASSDRA